MNDSALKAWAETLDIALPDALRDTNGSIRAPAALCGVWSIKPTFGNLPRQGMLAYASSLDCIGGFANDVQDLAALYSVLDGKASDERESRLRVGALSGYFETYASQQAWDAVLETASLIGSHDASSKASRPPHGHQSNHE
jgi:aspartyl-tRNA(Asn)/glutamyl-tRNA(Gln) amidotransferase subunit A